MQQNTDEKIMSAILLREIRKKSGQKNLIYLYVL
jgi:hypothetical protein